MEEIFLGVINDMAAEVKEVYEQNGANDELYKSLLQQLYGALHCLRTATNKNYIIEEDGKVKEFNGAEK